MTHWLLWHWPTLFLMIAYLHILSRLGNKDDHSAVNHIVIQGDIEESVIARKGPLSTPERVFLCSFSGGVSIP